MRFMRIGEIGSMQPDNFGLRSNDFPLDLTGMISITVLGLLVVFLVFLCATLFQREE